MSHPRAIIEILRYPKNLNMFGQLGFSPQKILHRLKKIPAPKKCPFQKVKKVSHEILHKQTKLPKDFLQQEKQFVDLFPESLAIMMNQASQLELTLRPRI